MGYIRNSVLINATIDDVFELTNNVRLWPDLFTEYASCEVLEEQEKSVTFRLTTHPDENGTQWSWISTRWTDADRKSTHSERDPSFGPFQKMVINWSYDQVSETATVMTWEQEFTMKPNAPFDDAHATHHLDSQTKIQQRIIKERVEERCAQSVPSEPVYHRGIIVGTYQPGSEEKIAAAFKASDETDLPHLIGVKSRHVWVLGNTYVHFIESHTSLPTVLKEYANHPLFQEVKADLDQYVSLIYPNLPPHAQQIYAWSE